MIRRRRVLGGLAAMSFPGGNPPMRADQAVNLARSRAGSGPAPQSAFVVAQRVIVFGTGPNRGIFVYSPVPGAGNLIGSWSAAAGTDPYGNAYLSGSVTYSTSGPPFKALQSDQGILGFFSAASQAGPWGLAQAKEFIDGSGDLFVQAGLNTQFEAIQGGGFVFAALTTITGPLLAITTSQVTSPVVTITNSTTSPSSMLLLTLAAAPDRAIGAQVGGDANVRFRVSAAGRIQWGPGSAGQDTTLERLAAGLLGVSVGSLSVSTAGQGLRVGEGANAKQGTAALTAGTVVVANTSVTANSRIFLTAQDNNSTGALRVSALTAGTSFTITSSNAGDSGVVAYQIFEPG